MNQDFIDFAHANYHVTNDTVRNQSNRVMAPANVFTDYCTYAVTNKCSTDGVDAQTIGMYFQEWVQDTANKKKQEKDEKNKSKAPKFSELLSLYLEHEGCHWSFNKNWTEISYYAENKSVSCPRPSDTNKLASFAYIWLVENGYSVKLDVLKTYLSTLVEKASGRTADSLFKTIGYVAEKEPDCDKCIAEIHELLKIDESLAIFSLFLKHWIWLVKRKLLGLKVVWEIWLNFYGATGVGKSTLIRALCKPLEDFYLEAQISVFADAARERDKFTRYYVLNFDELTVGGASKFLGDTDAMPDDLQREIKQFMTQEKYTSRNFQTQDQSTRRMTFTPISSANDHLYDIIYDEKTMRRYFEFNCTMDCHEADAAYYERKDALQKLLLSVWQGVDEHREEGYWNIHSDIWKETRAIQDSYYPTKTTTKLWIEDERVVFAEKGSEMHTLDMYRDYSKWCRERGYKARSERNWIEDVKHTIPGSHTRHRNISIMYSEDEQCE